MNFSWQQATLSAELNIWLTPATLELTVLITSLTELNTAPL